MNFLDTDVAVDVLRNRPVAIAWLQSLGEDQIGIPGFVMMELIEGCENKQAISNLMKLMKSYTVYWPAEVDSEQMRLAFPQYHLRDGTGVGDAMIAATAISHGATLYTFNTKHFRSIVGLQIVQPYQR